MVFAMISWQLLFAFIGGALITAMLLLLLLRSLLEKRDLKMKAQVKRIEHEAFLKSTDFKNRLTKVLNEKKHLERNYRNQIKLHQEKEFKLKEYLEELNADSLALKDQTSAIKQTEASLERKRNNLQNLRQLYRKRLLQITRIDEQKALEFLKEEIIDDYKADVNIFRQEALGKSIEEIETKAKRVLIATMQRLCIPVASHLNATLVKLPSDDIKGRIIGKEGRNIKSFESATGTTLVIDESPETVLISSFDPVRREIAHIALKALIHDGRIHPASIEEIVEKSQTEVSDNIMSLGIKSIDHLKLNNIPKEIIALLGKLHYRHSNNQNTLDHSIEVASICALLASELSLDPLISKRCGLFHDIGKAIGSETENSHALAAAQLLKRYGEDSRVINAISASHDETPSESVYAEILKIADKLSSTRPGARSDSMDGYVERIRNLENLVSDLDGIDDVYAIQAGKEIRVVVSPEMFKDHEASRLARKVKDRIEEELSYPGKIKVTVIREQRFVETAQ